MDKRIIIRELYYYLYNVPFIYIGFKYAKRFMLRDNATKYQGPT
jgi:hypothetical protein